MLALARSLARSLSRSRALARECSLAGPRPRHHHHHTCASQCPRLTRLLDQSIMGEARDHARRASVVRECRRHLEMVRTRRRERRLSSRAWVLTDLDHTRDVVDERRRTSDVHHHRRMQSMHRWTASERVPKLSPRTHTRATPTTSPRLVRHRRAHRKIAVGWAQQEVIQILDTAALPRHGHLLQRRAPR